MLITIFSGQGEKKEKIYDLTKTSGVSQLKAKRTRASKAGDSATLNEIKAQLQLIVGVDDREGDLLSLALQKLLAEQAEVIVKTNRASYDLRKEKKVKDLEKRLQAFAKKKDVKKLKEIKTQLDKFPDHSAAKKLAKATEKLISSLEAPVAYQPYTELLSSEFFSAPRERSAFHLISRQRKKALEKYSDPKDLQTYLAKPVTAKKKTGQENCQDLADYVLFDLFRNSAFQTQFTQDPPFKLFFIIAALGHFSHNSSHYPAQGHGKASAREVAMPGRYFRSECDHPTVEHIRKLTHPLKTPEQSTLCYGISNVSLMQLMIVQLDAKQEKTEREKLVTEQLTAINHLGRLQSKTSGSGVGPLLAHAGARVNNVHQYLIALRSLENLAEKDLALLFSRPIPSQGISEQQIAESTTALQKKISELHRSQALQSIDNLPSRMVMARTAQAQGIATSCAKLAQVKVIASDEANCLVLKLYPELEGDMRNSENIEQGLTNTIIGFLGGLINYNAHQKGLSVMIQRRQSFGFLESTITDIDSLQIRISLGLESEAFRDIIISSIQQLDQLLTDYNFIYSEKSRDQKTKELVRQVLTPCERSRSEAATAGNYLLNAMRTPDDQWIALLAAQKFLSTTEKTASVVEDAFCEYLHKFVLKRVEHKKIGESDHEQIKRFGFSIPQQAETKLAIPLASADCERLKKENIIFLLLQNLIQSALNYITQLTDIPKAYTCHYLLTKLLHACQKGMFILSHLHEYELTHLYAKAKLCIDSIFEHMAFLRFMIEKEQASEALIKEEKLYFAQSLKLDQKNFQVVYYDSGQQAIVASIFMMYEEFKTTCTARNIQLYLSDRSYYEVDRFCADMSISKTSLDKATLAFVDMMNIQVFATGLPKATKLKAVIIDITQNSTCDTLLRLSSLIAMLQQKGISVVLPCSLLKHEEAGQDKYQAGRSIIIPAPGMTLKKDYRELSQNAMNPLLASFRRTVRSCFDEMPSQRKISI